MEALARRKRCVLDFSVKCHMHGNVHVISITGDLDVAVAPKVRVQLSECLVDRPPCVLDLTQLTFCDSVGLSLMVGAMKQSSAFRVVIQSGQRNLRYLLKIVGFDQLFVLCASVDEAVSSCQ